MGIVRECHYEPRRGTVKQAIDYCKGLTPEKGNVLNPSFVEFGSAVGLESKPGHRTDLENACKCKNARELADKFPTVFVKFHKGFEALFNIRRA